MYGFLTDQFSYYERRYDVKSEKSSQEVSAAIFIQEYYWISNIIKVPFR